MPATSRILTTLPLLALLSACGGQVATTAPTLLSQSEIDSVAAQSHDTTRGAREASTLTQRGARLRARAERLRRATQRNAEHAALLRRAEELKQR